MDKQPQLKCDTEGKSRIGDNAVITLFPLGISF